MQTDHLTHGDIQAIRYASSALSACGLICVLLAAVILAVRKYESSETLLRMVKILPGRIFYGLLIVSIPSGIAWIIRASTLGANPTACKASMTILIFCWNFHCTCLLLLGFHVLFLLEWGDLRRANRVTLMGLVLATSVSIATSVVGLALGRYGPQPHNHICWITPAKSTLSSSILAQRMSAYKLEVGLYYGPSFFVVVASFALVGRVRFVLTHSQRKLGRTLQPAQIREITTRVITISGSLTFHCLLVFAGDLPVKFNTRSGQFVAHLLQYIGFTFFGITNFMSFFFVSAENIVVARRLLGLKPKPSDTGAAQSSSDEAEQSPVEEKAQDEFSCKMTESSGMSSTVITESSRVMYVSSPLSMKQDDLIDVHTTTNTFPLADSIELDEQETGHKGDAKPKNQTERVSRFHGRSLSRVTSSDRDIYSV